MIVPIRLPPMGGPLQKILGFLLRKNLAGIMVNRDMMDVILTPKKLFFGPPIEINIFLGHMNYAEKSAHRNPG